MMSTPCMEAPEAWVGNDDNLRAEAAKECTKCPAVMFAACQKLATVDPFGVLAGVDYGVKFKRADRTPEIDDVKECEQCGGTIHRGKRSITDWRKLRYCTRACYGVNRAVKGLPVVKVCEVCSAEFGRGGRSVQQWTSARFCGVTCSGRARSLRMAS